MKMTEQNTENSDDPTEELDQIKNEDEEFDWQTWNRKLVNISTFIAFILALILAYWLATSAYYWNPFGIGK